jgi:hypothetical protein
MPRLLSLADVSGLLKRPAKRPSARALASAAELKCTSYLARFGHLTTSDLSAAVWPNAKCGQDMAARTMRRLSAPGVELVACRQNALGTRSWILTRRGVAFLEVRGVAAHHGMDLASVSGSTFFHHSLDCQLELAGLIFAYNAEHSGHAMRIARAATVRWAQYSATERAKLARHVELIKIQLALPLVWLGHEAATLTL